MDTYEEWKRKQSEADLASSNVLSVILIILAITAYFL